MQRKCHKCNKLFTPEPASRTLCYECMPGEEPTLPGKLDKDMVAQIKKKDEAAKQHYYKKYISRKARMPMEKKKCQECGKEFEANALQRKYCYECRPSTVKKEAAPVVSESIARVTFNPTVEDEIKPIATSVLVKTFKDTMITRDDFIRMMEEEFKDIMALFKNKNKAYGDNKGEDTLRNFRKAANLLGGDTYPNMFIAAEVYKIKHNEALAKGIEVSECAERLRDNILYSLFQLAMVKEFNKSKVGGGLNG